jgi:hypothetical protein
MQSMKQLLGLYFFLMFPRFQKFTGEKLSLPPQENKAKVTNKPLCFNPVENLHFLPQLPAAHRKKINPKCLSSVKLHGGVHGLAYTTLLSS